MSNALLLPLLKQAHAASFAVPSFNVLSIDTALAVVEAAEEERAPVIVAVAELHFPYTDFDLLAPALLRLAERSSVPVVLHLDHAQSLDVVMGAMRRGFTSYQYDAYGLPMDERARKTRSVVDLAHSVGHAVEAEIGHITRVGSDSERAVELVADPGIALRFCEETGVDVIAAAVGNVHGLRAGEAAVDEALLKSLVSTLPAEISLHGGSGLSQADVDSAIAIGVAKISYYNNLGREACVAMRDSLDTEDPAYTDVMKAGRDRYQSAVRRQIRAYGASSQAHPAPEPTA